jgi:hypothetical protein
MSLTIIGKQLNFTLFSIKYLYYCIFKIASIQIYAKSFWFGRNTCVITITFACTTFQLFFGRSWHDGMNHELLSLLDLKLGIRRVRPVIRGCLHLLDTRLHLSYIQGFTFAYLLFIGITRLTVYKLYVSCHVKSFISSVSDRLFELIFFISWEDYLHAHLIYHSFNPSIRLGIYKSIAWPAMM